MTSLAPQPRGFFVLLALGVLSLATAGCPKKEVPAQPEAEAPPPPPPQPEASVVDLAPIATEDAGTDAGDAAVKKPTGPAVNPNVARFRQCCGQLKAEGKRLGSSPEANILLQAGAQCDALAGAAGGNSPEFNVIKGMLQGRTLPAVCQGL